MEKKGAFALIGLFLIIGAGIFIYFQFFYEDNSNYSNKDPYEQDKSSFKEKVSNVTLIVDYKNGTVNNWTNVNLANYNTTCYDLTIKFCQVRYTVFYLNNATGFYITEINGLAENVNQNLFWQYYVNGVYANVGTNLFQLEDNDIITWKYGVSEQP